MTLLGAMTTAGGLFLFLWYRTLVSLPVRQQPSFILPAAFKWGIPAISLILFLSGLFILATLSPWYALIAAGLAASLGFLLLKFDRYSADIRLIHDTYKKIRQANPSMEELEALFHTARWRYPKWTDDRAVELVAGKDIASLILVMLVSENKINPISDWELYRTLKFKVARMTRHGT
jgi:hypothetical protein